MKKNKPRKRKTKDHIGEKFIGVWVEAEIHRRFREICHANGKTMAEMLRDQIVDWS